MKFGFASTPVGPKGSSDAELYREAVEDAAYGQELGYDSAWALEHHFTPYFPQPDLMVYLSHLAARCPGLGLGTCVIVLPWHHPLRIAEQIAMLSLLSEGDLYLGLGRGTARYEFDRFGVDMAETRGRFREMVQIIRLGLKGERFTFEGEHYRIPETLLRPVGNPERVHLFGAVGSPESAGVMADLDLPLMHTSNFPDRIAEEFVATWRARKGVDDAAVAGLGMPMMINPTIVTESQEEARELARTYFPHFARTQMEHYETRDDYWKDIPGYQAHSRFFANLGKLAEQGEALERFLDFKLVGTPEMVIRRIETLRERIGIGHIISVHSQYEMDHTLRRRSMKLFAEEVIPHFRKGAEAA